MQSIYCLEPEMTNCTRTHSHEYGQIVVQTKGAFYLSFHGKEYVLTPDVMAFVPPYCEHGFRSDEQNKTILFNIPSKMINRSGWDLLQTHPILQISDSMRPVIDLIKKEAMENGNNPGLKYLFYYVYEKFISQCQLRSVRYIHEHYAEDISVQMLAALENYNISYYTEWFRNQTGFTPGEYLQHTRIEYAKHLLHNTDLKVSEIANSVGYQNSSAFTRAFRQIVGTAPTVYRDIHLE